MTIELTEHDLYVEKINGLIEDGRDELAAELAEQYVPGGPSGRAAFWATGRSSWFAHMVLDAGEPTIRTAAAGAAVIRRVPLDRLTDQDCGELLRD